MVVNKVHEKSSFKQSKCFEKFLSFNTQQTKLAEKKIFKRILIEYSVTVSMEVNRKSSYKNKNRSYQKK